MCFLRRKVAKIDSVLGRQIHILEWYLERFRCLPEYRVIRYDAIVSSGGRSLNVIAPAATYLAEPLSHRNDNPLYEQEHMIQIGRRLIARSGVLWDFYDRVATERVLAALTDRSGSWDAVVPTITRSGRRQANIAPER
jgi:hypothetical protein